MKRAGPGEGVCHHPGLWYEHLPNALDTALHRRTRKLESGELEKHGMLNDYDKPAGELTND